MLNVQFYCISSFPPVPLSGEFATRSFLSNPSIMGVELDGHIIKQEGPDSQTFFLCENVRRNHYGSVAFLMGCMDSPR